MNSIAQLLVLSTLMLIGSLAEGADLVLREHATQHGPIIRLGDIADIAASSNTELDALARIPLVPAPAKGTRQFLSAVQVRDLLVARGVQLDFLTFSGAKTVEVGAEAFVESPNQPAPTAPLTVEGAELRVKQAIEQHLQTTSGATRWRVELSLSKHQAQKAAALGADLVASHQQPLRPGRRRFTLSSPSKNHELVITADITQVQSVVVVVNPIDRGQLIRGTDVEIRDREGNLPKMSLTDLDQVIGQVAERTLHPDSIIQKSFVRAPWLVQRGETVNVYVRTGGIAVRTRAIARENGALGELVAVERLEDKQRLDVSVSGPGEVTLYATGGSTADYASLSPSNRARR